MKKFFIAFLVLSMFFVDSVCAEENVSIEDLYCKNTYNGDNANTIIANKESMSINISNISFRDIGDNIECTFNIKNNNSEKIKIDSIKYDKNEFISYDIVYDSNSILGKNDKTSVKIDISYIKEVSDNINLNSVININIDTSSNNATLVWISSGIGNIFNFTNVTKGGIFSILIFSISIALLYIKRERVRENIITFAILSLIFISAFGVVDALSNNSIIINSEIELENKTAVDTIMSIVEDADQTSIYEIGQTGLAYDRTNDNNLRYIGADPNNYVIFNNELWRIIGVMNNVDDGNGNKETRIKLMRSEPLGTYSWNTSSINEWSQSDLANELNGDYLNTNLTSNTNWGYSEFDYTKVLSTTAQEMIDNAVYYTGGISQTTGFTPRNMYIAERKNKIYSGTDDGVTRTSSWTGKVAIMNASDYGYATSGGSERDRYTCLATTMYMWDSHSDCYLNDWIYNSDKSNYGAYQWTINPTLDNPSSIYFVDDNVYLNDSSNSSDEVSPVVYLKSSVKIISGDGTIDNPYQLSL